MAATQGYVYDDSFIADGALAKYRVVIWGGSDQRVKYPTQDNSAIVGITQESTSASGDRVLVRRAGITKVEAASGNITRGLTLRAYDAVGRVDRQGDAWVSGDGVVGMADQASAASGDIIEMWLNIRTVLG